MNNGATWYFHADTLQRLMAEEDASDFLQGHVVELAQDGS
jgi:hypothetical protein